MSTMLTGSDLARAMLKRGDTDIWCVVADSSDKEAMRDISNNDFTVRIVSFTENGFICSAGTEWACAVPIKVVIITETIEEVCHCGCF